MRLFRGMLLLPWKEQTVTAQQSFLAVSGKQWKAVTDPLSIKWKTLLLFPILVSPFKPSHSNSFALLLAVCPCKEKQGPINNQIYHWGNSADLITLATYLTCYIYLPLLPP